MGWRIVKGSFLGRVCKVFVTLFVRIADYTEGTEDAEGGFGSVHIDGQRFFQLSGAMAAVSKYVDTHCRMR